MLQIKHYETLETFNNEKNNLETPYIAYVEENSTIYYSVDDVIKYIVYLVKQKDISNITYEAVDLGLPSGVKWADRNIGATDPEHYGSYFQWGDTNAYTVNGVSEITAAELAEILNPLLSTELGMEITTDNVAMVLEQIGLTGTDLTNTPMGGLGFSLDKEFNWETYFDTTDGGSTFNKYNINSSLTVLESSDDAATVNMGNTWRMPTKEELSEFMGYTMPTFIDIDRNEFNIEQTENGAIELGKLKGVRFTGLNGNSIFIPAAGYCNEAVLANTGVEARLYVANSYYGDGGDRAISFGFSYDGYYSPNSDRCWGLPVRGVLKQ
jgi:hypothetical protein